MPDKPSEPPPLAHFEDTTAPIVYADACMGGGPMNGDNVTLTFATKFLDHRTNPPTNATKTVLRLVMARGAVSDLADFARGLLAALDAGSAPPEAKSLN